MHPKLTSPSIRRVLMVILAAVALLLVAGVPTAGTQPAVKDLSVPALNQRISALAGQMTILEHRAASAHLGQKRIALTGCALAQANRQLAQVLKHLRGTSVPPGGLTRLMARMSRLDARYIALVEGLKDVRMPSKPVRRAAGVADSWRRHWLGRINSPSVSITSPQSGASVLPAATIRITGTAKASGTIRKVDVRIDRGRFTRAKGASRWARDWTVPAAASGTHRITARVTDSAGRTTSATVSVRVQTSAPAAVAAEPAASEPVAPTGLLLRNDLIYGSEIGCWQTDGGQAADTSTAVPGKVVSAGIPAVRFAVYDVFTDMLDPAGSPGTIRRSDFDHAIDGIVNTLGAIPWIKLLPVASGVIGVKPGTVFAPPLNDLGRDLEVHKAVLAQIRTVYSGPIIIESDNEGEYDCYRTWGYASAGDAGVSRALGRKYAAIMPALKKYARDVLGFSQVITVGYVGVAGGANWGQSVTADPSQPYGYRCGYQPRWVDEFNTEIRDAYVASGCDPDYVPDVESIHAYPHSPDFTSQAGYEYDDNIAYAYYRNWIVQSRARVKAIWGAERAAAMKFAISEWNAGSSESTGTWSGWSSPARVQDFYAGWLDMLRGDGDTGSTRYWGANCFLIAGNPSKGTGSYYNIIRADGSTPAWYETFRGMSLNDPLRL